MYVHSRVPLLPYRTTRGAHVFGEILCSGTGVFMAPVYSRNPIVQFHHRLGILLCPRLLNGNY